MNLLSWTCKKARTETIGTQFAQQAAAKGLGQTWSNHETSTTQIWHWSFTKLIFHNSSTEQKEMIIPWNLWIWAELWTKITPSAFIPLRIYGTGMFTYTWMVDFYGFHVGKYYHRPTGIRNGSNNFPLQGTPVAKGPLVVGNLAKSGVCLSNSEASAWSLA